MLHDYLMCSTSKDKEMNGGGEAEGAELCLLVSTFLRKDGEQNKAGHQSPGNAHLLPFVPFVGGLSSHGHCHPL